MESAHYLKSARTTTGKVANDVRVTRRVQVKSCWNICFDKHLIIICHWLIIGFLGLQIFRILEILTQLGLRECDDRHLITVLMIWQLWWWWWWGFEIICCYTPDNRTRLTKGHCSPSPCDLSFGFQTFANILWGLSFGKFGIGKKRFGFGNFGLGKSLSFGIFGLGKEGRNMTRKRQRDNDIMNLNKIVCC